jgi:hypothetical protein
MFTPKKSLRTQRWGTARTLPKFLCCSIYCLFCVVVCKCVLNYCHRVATQLQLINISYHIISKIMQVLVHIFETYRPAFLTREGR